MESGKVVRGQGTSRAAFALAWAWPVTALVLFASLASPALGQPLPAPELPGSPSPRAASRPHSAHLEARHAALAGPRLVIPLVASAETSPYGRLSTVLEIANVSGSLADYTMRLRGTGGRELPMLLQFGCPACPVLSSTLYGALNLGDGSRVAILPDNLLRIGWAEFTSEPVASLSAEPVVSLSVATVLRAEASDGTVSRAEIPPAALYRRAWLHTDNTAGAATALVLVNPGAEAQTLAFRYRGFASAERTCESSVRLLPLGQAVVETGTSLACSVGGRGLIEIRGPAEFAGIGLISSETDGILARQFVVQAPEPYVALPQWAVAPGQIGFGTALAGGCVTLAHTRVGGTAYTVHSSKWQRRTHAGDAWTDVPGTARTGQLCPYEPDEQGEYRAVADITVGDKRGTFASSDILTVEEGPIPPAPLPPPIPGLEEFTNDVGMQFVKIPAGEFSMGATGAWEWNNELPVTRVRISKAFWMGKHEVTQGQWQAVTGRNPSFFANCGVDCPVEQVSWDDVQDYITKLNEREGETRYRLPTEAEWEYAAKAGTETDTHAGDLSVLGHYNAPLLDVISWYGGNSGVAYDGGYDCPGVTGKRQYESSRCGTHPVGRKAPNRFALHDVLGNVWEWVQDWDGDYPQTSGGLTNII